MRPALVAIMVHRAINSARVTPLVVSATRDFRELEVVTFATRVSGVPRAMVFAIVLQAPALKEFPAMALV